MAVATYFKKMDGVKDASADGAKTATVVFDPKKTSIEKLLEGFKGKDDRFKAYKPGETPPEPKYTYTGKPESLGGRMTVRDPADTTKNVVARLIAHRSGEPTERIFNLIGESDMATKIEAKRKEGVNVTVTGVVSAEGIKVEKIE